MHDRIRLDIIKARMKGKIFTVSSSDFFTRIAIFKHFNGREPWLSWQRARHEAREPGVRFPSGGLGLRLGRKEEDVLMFLMML